MPMCLSRKFFASAIVAVALLASLAGASPEPWVHPDGSIHYYDAISRPSGLNWIAAFDSAEGYGGYLATITSAAENDFVFSLVDSSLYWHQRQGSGKLAGPWLGGTQDFGSPEPDSGWHWATDETMNYLNWSKGQPDNQGGNENALHFGESAGVRLPNWDDASRLDDSIRGFVRELSADSTTVGLFQNDSNAFEGYNLFSNRGSRNVYLIDNKGRLVHKWVNPTYGIVAQYYLTPGGKLLHIDNLLNPKFWDGGRVAMLDWDGNEVWGYDYSDSTKCLHHDAMMMPNGHVLFLAYEYKSGADAIAAGRDTAKLTDGRLSVDHIVEVNPANDSIVWMWHAWDHLIQDFDSTKANYGLVADHSELIDLNFTVDNTHDWLHCDGLNYNAQYDQILVSSQRFSEVWVIDHSTTTAEAAGHSGGRQGMGGDILYRWGNPQTYRAGTNSDRKFYGGVHAGNWIKAGLPGAGHLLAFNGGTGRPGGNGSSVDEWIPPVDSTGHYTRPAPGNPFGPESLCWRYIASPPSSFYGANMGGAERLPNGNTLTAEATKGRFREVTQDSQVVWRYMCPEVTAGESIMHQGDTVSHGPVGWESNSFRAVRYAPDYAGLAGQNLTPGYPIELYETRQYVGLEQQPTTGYVPTGLAVNPNPFGRSATIRFSLPRAASTELGIYSVDGRLVRTLQATGGLVTWDGLDNAGRQVGRGVYCCRLQGLGFGASRKIVKTE
jgi:hypothetical protein